MLRPSIEFTGLPVIFQLLYINNQTHYTDCCCCCCCCCDYPVHRAALLGHHYKKNDNHLVLSID